MVEVRWELMPAWSWDSLSSTIIMIRALTEALLYATYRLGNLNTCPKVKQYTNEALHAGSPRKKLLAMMISSPSQ